MDKGANRGLGPVVSVSIAGAFALVAASSAALALTSAPAPATASIHSSVQAESACRSPLVENAGGVCCPGGESSPARCVNSRSDGSAAREVELPPLSVNGVEIPTPIIVQLVKKSLTRAWSRGSRDRNVLVCRRKELPGTSLPQIYCDTNGGHFHSLIGANYHVKTSDKKIYCYNDCFLTKGNVEIPILRYVNGNSTVDRNLTVGRRLAALLLRAPKANADYSLRLPETVPMRFPESGGRVVDMPVYVTFVVSDGELKDVLLADRKKAQ